MIQPWRKLILILVMVVGMPASAFQQRLAAHCQSQAFRHSLEKRRPEASTVLCATNPEKEDGGRNLTRKHHHGLPSQLIRAMISSLLVFQIAVSSFGTNAHAADISGLAVGQRYWTLMNADNNDDQAKVQANKALMDYAVGTINNMYYDNTGGASFSPREFFALWRSWFADHGEQELATREGVVKGMTWLTQQLNDPFSKYLTREELVQELETNNDGFLGLGAMVDPASQKQFFGALRTPVLSEIPPSVSRSKQPLLSANEVSALPVLTAVAPTSPAERAGLTVGDRIVAIQKDVFLGLTPEAAANRLASRYSAENYLGSVDLTIAKPVYASSLDDDRNVIVAYRPQRARLTTMASSSTVPSSKNGGLLQYQMLAETPSPFRSVDEGSGSILSDKVGYIRLTRFSKASTAAFVKAVDELEQGGATAYIVDLRNNYGGVIQEAMLTASSLLRDPHSVLCYTLNSRGGFTPHPVEEYVMDTRYPGYLLSREPKSVTLQQVKKESPDLFQGGSRLARPSSRVTYVGSSRQQSESRQYQIMAAQKPVLLLVNEGTASAAEVFTSALHDNGRTVAVVGTKTYGKGLIQHTFPLPDGGGLRLTVAEYLTPALRHMTHVGGAQFDRRTGEWVGGGIQPDVTCDNTQGIPANAGSDLCVGVGLDVLTEAKQKSKDGQFVQRTGGVGVDGAQMRRPVTVGVVRDTF